MQPKMETFGFLFDIERRLVGAMEKYGLRACRLAIGVVFIWFGILKPFGLSPADQLVRDVTFWAPIPNFVTVLGIWEVVIGLCFLYRPLIRLGLLLMFLHMPGTILPFFLVPDRCWHVFPFALSLEGQYIVKNLVLVAAALVIGGKIRYRMNEVAPFASEQFLTLLNHGSWIGLKAGAILIEQGEHHKYLYYLFDGRANVLVDGRVAASLERGQFVGEMSFLTNEGAGATVIAAEPLRLVRWSKADLSKRLKEEPQLMDALQVVICRDLVGKLRQKQPLAATPQPAAGRRVVSPV